MAFLSYLALPIAIHGVASRAFAVAYPWTRGIGLIFAGLICAIVIPWVPGTGLGALGLRAFLTLVASAGILWFGVGESVRAPTLAWVRKLEAMRRGPLGA